jgi:hypothetical protein
MESEEMGGRNVIRPGTPTYWGFIPQKRCMVHNQKQKNVMMDVEMFREILLDMSPGITKFRA